MTILGTIMAIFNLKSGVLLFIFSSFYCDKVIVWFQSVIELMTYQTMTNGFIQESTKLMNPKFYFCSEQQLSGLHKFISARGNKTVAP